MPFAIYQHFKERKEKAKKRKRRLLIQSFYIFNNVVFDDVLIKSKSEIRQQISVGAVLIV